MDKNLNFTLLEDQKKALKFILDRPKAGLFLPTGCGKTLVSLLYLKILNQSAIIVVEATKKDIWLGENQKFNLGLDITTEYSIGGKILLVSYDWLKNYPEVLDDYNTIIYDEAHCISNTETIRYKQLSERTKAMQRVVLLAGYPVENHLQEIFVVSLITDVLGKNYYHFLNRYFHVIRKGNRIIKAIPKPDSFQKILDALKDIVFVMDKSNAVKAKPKNIVVRYELSDYQKNIINMLGESGNYVDENISISCKNKAVAFQKVMQVVSGFVYLGGNKKGEPLVPVLFDENPKLKLLDKIISNKGNFILWYFFDSELGMLKKYSKICRLSKLQIDSRGRNLQHMGFAVYFTLPLSGGMMQQSIDRIIRYGREKDVVSIFLLPNGEFGNRMLKMIDTKFKLTNDFIKGLLKLRV